MSEERKNTERMLIGREIGEAIQNGEFQLTDKSALDAFFWGYGQAATVKAHEVTRENSEGNIEPFHCNCEGGPYSYDDEKKLMSDVDKYKKQGTCAAFIKLNDDWENAIKHTSYWGFPHTYADGTSYKDSEPVEGVTMASILFCSHGGFITPVTSGQEYSGEIFALACTTSGEHKGKLEQEQQETNARYIYEYLHGYAIGIYL